MGNRNQQKMLRYAIKNKLSEETLALILVGTATKAQVYSKVIGKHPTKKREVRK